MDPKSRAGSCASAVLCHSVRLRPFAVARLGLACLVLALIAESGRSASTGARPLAPGFTLRDTEGRSHSLADLRGRTVTLFFFCGCRACHECARSWAAIQRAGVLAPALPLAAVRSSAHTATTATVVVYMGAPGEAREFAAATGMQASSTLVLADPRLEVTMAYHAAPCPRAIALDRAGRVCYINNHLDDQPQKASAAAITAHCVDALRHAETENPQAGHRRGEGRAHGARHQ